MAVAAQRHHEHYKVIRKMIGKICESKNIHGLADCH